ncbi:hypothetical protein P3X46_002389, partial [Hevea brasiliensis]
PPPPPPPVQPPPPPQPQSVHRSLLERLRKYGAVDFRAPIFQPPSSNLSDKAKPKISDFLKLNALKYNEGDDPFEYVKVIKMIVEELGTSDSKAILMTGFTLKCKKAKEWYKHQMAHQ